MKGRYEVIVDPQLGYRRLEPLPTAEELDTFYRERYYDLVTAGGRAPELRRLMRGGEEAQSELACLSQTMWRDVLDVLDQHVGHRKERWLLDVGCGPGHFGRYMQQAGWQVMGVEPSQMRRRSPGLSGYQCMIPWRSVFARQSGALMP